MTDPGEAVAVDWRHKGFPQHEPRPVSRGCGWNLLDGDLPTPVLVLKEAALEHNISVVHTFCDAVGVSIAPHLKTTMSPEIMRRQLAAGAWGMTVANVSQARIARRFGCARVLIANQVVDPAGVGWLVEQLQDADVEVFSLVDSPDSVAILDAALRRAGSGRSAQVLLEVGLPGGRTGCRGAGDIARTLEAVDRAALVELAGVEAYEGVIHVDDGDTGPVDDFLAGVRSVALDIASTRTFVSGEFLLSAGGSSFPDRVIDAFGDWPDRTPVRIVVRSGCYVTHDHGYYEHLSPFGARSDTAPLVPALEIWGSVVSRPEPDLVLVNFGKRDVSYDIGLPTPLHVKARDEPTLRPATGMTIFDLNDQHAYLRVTPADPISVGDLVAAGLSHPCTVFDKWRVIPVVDDRYEVVDAISTYF